MCMPIDRTRDSGIYTSFGEISNMISYKFAKARHIRLGMRGESLAAAYLALENIEILLRNYRNKHGEIDIVARDGATLCFIEVKTRRFGSRSRPAEGLSEKQKNRIGRSAASYLRSIGYPEVVYRFDLVEVVLGNLDVVELRYWRSHFVISSL